jgi:ATP-dependent Clp protease ATP-binding subunit ClpB
VNFKNTIIIMTSNVGSDIIQDNFDKMTPANEDQIAERTKDEVFALLKKSMRPEFLNRIDEVIMFRPLSRKDIISIVKLQVDQLSEKLTLKGISLSASSDALAYLADKGFDPQFGARPVKRLIQKEVLNELSKQLLAGSINREEPIVMDVFDGQVVFRKPLDEELRKLVREASEN